MRVQKKVLFLSVFLMIVGFAAVSTTLYLNGTIGVGTNELDFDVYFSKAIENGVENNSLIQDKRHITFTTELSKIDERYVLDYEVTNASKQYDASVTINCTGGNEYLRVENEFNIAEPLKARKTRKGRFILTVIKSTLEEISVDVLCEITGNALEKDTVGSEVIQEEQLNCLANTELDYKTLLNQYIIEEYGSYEEFERIGEEICSGGDDIACDNFEQNLYNKFYQWIEEKGLDKTLWREINISNVESITFKNTKEVPEGIEGIDVSNKQDGSIMMYSEDKDNDSLLEIYIGQNEKVIANPDSSYLFKDFENLEAINGLENLDTSNVTSMYAMFSGCSKLTTLDLSHFDTLRVVYMGNMFVNCGNMTTLDISYFNTSNVIRTDHMFSNCSALVNLNLSNFDTKNIKNMEYMFSNCSNIESLNLSHFDTHNVTNMEYMFYNCGSLTKLDVSSFDTSNVTDMWYMFNGCRNLTTLDLSHFDTSKVKNMSSMFQECTSLIDLNVSHFDTSNVTGMGYMFSNCRSLVTLDVSHFITNKVDSMRQLFYKCESLTTLDVSQFETSNVTNMGAMFYGCSSLTMLDVSHFGTSQVTDMSNMFYDCNGLTNLDVSHFETSNVANMERMFSKCSNLINLDVSHFDTGSVKNMRNMFSDCRKLKTAITIRGILCTIYGNMFVSAATSSGAQITVNYTIDASELVDKMIATKSSTSNVVKGIVVT